MSEREPGHGVDVIARYPGAVNQTLRDATARGGGLGAEDLNLRGHRFPGGQ